MQGCSGCCGSDKLAGSELPGRMVTKVDGSSWARLISSSCDEEEAEVMSRSNF